MAEMTRIVLEIPLTVLILYLVLVTLCLLLARIQLGLTLTFVFVFYLGFIHNFGQLMRMVEASRVASIGYFASGVVVLGLAVTSFLTGDQG